MNIISGRSFHQQQEGERRSPALRILKDKGEEGEEEEDMRKKKKAESTC